MEELKNGAPNKKNNMVKYLIWGLSPLLIGFILDGLIKQGFEWGNIMLSGISIVFFVYWYSLGYNALDHYDKCSKAYVVTNCFSILFFAVGAVMVFFTGTFPENIIGHLCEVFFFPAYSISRIVMVSLIEEAPDFACLVLSFILMSATYISGYMQAKKFPITA